MADRPFRCTASEPFDLFALRESTARALRTEGARSARVLVTHPDKEADGSCRWCGCREDEVVTVEIP